MKGVLHSFSMKNIFYDKIDLRLFYFDVAIYWLQLHLLTKSNYLFKVNNINTRLRNLCSSNNHNMRRTSIDVQYLQC